MRPVKPAAEFSSFGAPPGWDEKSNGPCGTLPVLRTVEGVSGPSPFLSFKSHWQPDSVELAKLNSGHVVQVEAIHVQPALSISAVPCADPEAVKESPRAMEAIRGAVARGWCHDPNREKEVDSDLAIAISEEVAALFGVANV